MSKSIRKIIRLIRFRILLFIAGSDCVIINATIKGGVVIKSKFSFIAHTHTYPEA